MELPIYEDESEAHFTTEVVQLSGDTAFKICELLGLDPNKVNAILIEADGQNGYETVTIKRLK